MLASLFLPIFRKELSSEAHALYAFSVERGSLGSEFAYLGLGSIIGAILSLVALGFYKNRPLQLRICDFNFLVIGGSFFLAIYYVSKYLEPLPGPEGRYDLGAYALVVAMAGNLLARFFIRKDEKLVRDSDRLL